MNDTISRTDAIKHLKKRLYETALNSNTEHPYYEEIADNRIDVWMNEVPSVEPDVPDTNVGDMISRKAAINAVHKNYDTILDFKSDGRTVADSFEDIINDLPSAEPGQDDWIPVNGIPPKDGQKCLLTVEYFGSKEERCVEIGTYSKDLYKTDKYDFYDKKGKAGWYDFDPEYGLCETLDVKAWKPLDEPYMGD